MVSTRTLPPLARTCSATSASPRPVPLTDCCRAPGPRQKRSKIRSRSATGMPGPRSSTVKTRTSSVRASRLRARDAHRRGSPAWCSALSSRLTRTRSTRRSIEVHDWIGPGATLERRRRRIPRAPSARARRRRLGRRGAPLRLRRCARSRAGRARVARSSGSASRARRPRAVCAAVGRLRARAPPAPPCTAR